MRRIVWILFIFILLIFSCSNSEIEDYQYQLPPHTVIDNDTCINDFYIIQNDTTIGFDISSISTWMNNTNNKSSYQGGDVYKDLLFQFKANHVAVDIIDMKNKMCLGTMSLPSLGSSYHCNNADFSNFFYDDIDEFPLLYSSHQGKSARCILVDRIIIKNGNYTLKTVQRIDLPYEDDIPLQYTPDAIVDKENGFLYVYTGNTIPISDFFIYQFRLPTIKEGFNVKLVKEDIIRKWTIIHDPVYYKQGGMIENGMLYVMEGVPYWNTDNVLRIVDLNECKYKTINLSKNFNVKWESEDIFQYDGDLFISTNGLGVHQLHLKKCDK